MFLALKEYYETTEGNAEAVYQAKPQLHVWNNNTPDGKNYTTPAIVVGTERIGQLLQEEMSEFRKKAQLTVQQYENILNSHSEGLAATAQSLKGMPLQRSIVGFVGFHQLEENGGKQYLPKAPKAITHVAEKAKEQSDIAATMLGDLHFAFQDIINLSVEKLYTPVDMRVSNVRKQAVARDVVLEQTDDGFKVVLSCWPMCFLRRR